MVEHFLAAFLALILVTIGALYWVKLDRESEWITAVLDVPSFTKGENPQIRHVRRVFENHSANWHIELILLDEGNKQICSAGGNSFLGVKENENFRFTFDGMFQAKYRNHQEPCDPKPGRYIIQLIYKTEGKNPYVTYSNEFEIYDPKD